MTEQDDRLWARGNEQAASPVGAARPDDAARPVAPANGAVPARRWDAAPGNLESAAHDPVAPDPPPRRVPRAMGIAPERPAPPRGAVGRRRRAGWVVAGAAVGLAGAAIAVALIAGRGAERPVATVFHVPGKPTGLVASGGRVWVAGPEAGSVWVLDAATGRPARPPLHVGGRPARLALEPRFAWIADTERSAVIRVSTSDRGARRSTRTGPDIADVTVAAGAVWTASSADGTVRVLDGRRSPLVLRVGLRPIALAGHEQRVVVLDAAGSLFRLDATTRRQLGPPIDLGGAPVDVALLDGVAWVADARDRTVRAVEVGAGIAATPVDVGGTPVAIAADAGGVYVVTKGDRALVSLDPDGDVRARLPLEHAPTALALDSRHVWIAAGADEVIRVDRLSAR